MSGSGGSAGASIEQFGADFPRAVDYRADKNSSRIVAVIDNVSLKAKTPISGVERGNVLPDEREVCKQAEGALQSRKVSLGLIGAEADFAVFIDDQEVAFGAFR